MVAAGFVHPYCVVAAAVEPAGPASSTAVAEIVTAAAQVVAPMMLSMKPSHLLFLAVVVVLMLAVQQMEVEALHWCGSRVPVECGTLM